MVFSVRIVTVAGKEKAFEVFNETKRIESEGGMLIMVQSNSMFLLCVL